MRLSKFMAICAGLHALLFAAISAVAMLDDVTLQIVLITLSMTVAGVLLLTAWWVPRIAGLAGLSLSIFIFTVSVGFNLSQFGISNSVLPALILIFPVFVSSVYLLWMCRRH